MANTFLLTLATVKPKTQVGGGIFRVRGTITAVLDGSAFTEDGETMKFKSLTQGLDIGVNESATVVSLKKALQLPNVLTHIQALGLLIESETTPEAAYLWNISTTTGKLMIFGSSATAGEIRESATVNAQGAAAPNTKTFTAQFMAEGW